MVLISFPETRSIYLRFSREVYGFLCGEEQFRRFVIIFGVFAFRRGGAFAAVNNFWIATIAFRDKLADPSS